MKQKILNIVVYILAAILLIVCILIHIQYDSSKREVRELQTELAHASIYQPIQHDTIRDSIKVATQNIYMVDKSDAKKVLDKSMLRDVGISTKQIETVSNTTSRTADSVIVRLKNNTFSYRDKWCYFHLIDSTFNYSVTDSLSTIIYREYRHHFLFFRWGTKGYRIKIISLNPHSTVLYNNTIKIK